MKDAAIKYVQESYVSDSKGSPCMLLGDVASLLSMITGEEILLSELGKYSKPEPELEITIDYLKSLDCEFGKLHPKVQQALNDVWNKKIPEGKSNIQLRTDYSWATIYPAWHVKSKYRLDPDWLPEEEKKFKWIIQSYSGRTREIRDYKTEKELIRDLHPMKYAKVVDCIRPDGSLDESKLESVGR